MNATMTLDDDYGAADEAAWDAGQAAAPYRRADGLEWAAAIVAAAHAAGWYRLPRGAVAGVEKKLAGLARKAGRVGVEAPTLTVELVELVDCGEAVREYVVVRLRCQTIRLQGWALAARLDHLYGAEAGTIIAAVPGTKLAGDYRHHPGTCDHCHTSRVRASTCVLRHVDGREVVVGSSCLREFLGGHDPHVLLALAEMAQAAAAACEDGEDEESGSYGGGRELVRAAKYVAQVAQTVRTCGWMPRSRASVSEPATADIALARLFALKREVEDRPTEQDKARAEAALAWAAALTDDEVGSSDYLHNLRVVCRAGVIGSRGFGLAASVIAAHDRAQQREIERRKAAAGANEWFGVVGQVTVRRLTVTRIIECDGQFGVSFLHIMQDEDGRRAKWFASRPEFEAGEVAWVGGAVKAHDTYEGHRQTQLTRCFRAEDPAEVAPSLAGLTTAQGRRLHARAMGRVVGKASAVDKRLEGLGLLASDGTLTDKGRELLAAAGVPVA